MRRLQRTLCAALVAGLLPVAGAWADVAGPDDSIADAFGPLAPETVYSGAFKSETDVDYLTFDVAQAGQTLHFDVANTVRRCASANLTGCPLYATLLDGGGRQLGGEGSSAGTGAVSEDANLDVIDWTFDAAGHYYVAMDSDGDGPTYTVRYRVVSPAAAVPGTGTAPVPGTAGGTPTGTDPSAPGSSSPARRAIASLRVAPRQRGSALRVRLTVGRALRGLTARLQDRRGRMVARQRLATVAPGKHALTLRLDAAARRALTRRGTAALRLRIVASPVTGAPQTARRAILLARR